MNLDQYELLTHSPFEFQFFSEGPRGRIQEVIRFTSVNARLNLYNLGFGDFDPRTGFIDDRSNSANKDEDKVLATVAQAAVLFSEAISGALIYAEGSDAVRTRRYQMGLNKHWQVVSELFAVWGLRDGAWVPFEKGKNYTAFLAKRR